MFEQLPTWALVVIYIVGLMPTHWLADRTIGEDIEGPMRVIFVWLAASIWFTSLPGLILFAAIRPYAPDGPDNQFVDEEE